MLKLVSSWDLNNTHTRWIIKHACRSLIKKGNPEALKLFNFHESAAVSVDSFILKPARLVLGKSLFFSFKIRNDDSVPHRFAVDYAVTYARRSGGSSRKVFKLKEISLKAGEEYEVRRNQVFKDFTTRSHFKGQHLISILVNGKQLAEKSFYLSVPAGT